MSFYEQLARLEASGTPFALATIIHASENSPGRTSFKMCVTQDGKSFGSIGGGALEYRVQKIALDMFRTGESTRLESFRLSDADKGGIGMACGGEADVFIELNIPRPQLVIFGGGHIGGYLTQFASEVGFLVTVVDDRSEYASPQRHPKAAHTLQARYHDVLSLELPKSAFFVIVTHQHIGDGICLEGLLKRPELEPRYIGLIGSAKKLARVFRQMIDEGISRESLEFVHAPIGLNHGGQSASEIAIAIAAEIIAVRYGKTLQDSMCVKKHPLLGMAQEDEAAPAPAQNPEETAK